MRKLFILLLGITSFYGNAQTFVKSIYSPTWPYLHGAAILQNSSGTYNAFTDGEQLKTLGLDSTGNILWTKSINTPDVSILDELAVDRISDSTFIVGTNCYYVEYDYKFYLAKVNASGEPVWIKSVGEDNYYQEIHNLRHTADGGSISVGYKTGGSMGSWHAKVYIVKADSIGNVEWAKGYDRSGNMETAMDVTETEDGFLIVGGTDSSAVISGSYGFMIKTDKSGNTIWRKAYRAPLAIATSIVKDGNSLVIAGCNWPFLYQANDSDDVILLKTDTAGNPVWTKQFHFPYWVIATKIIRTIDGGYLL